MEFQTLNCSKQFNDDLLREVEQRTAELGQCSLKSKIAACLGVEESGFYLTCNGKILSEDTGEIQPVDGFIHIIPRLLGGKGGFGSMLRAIGAQIEKTTNRDACRDLSGRRLRDINEEQRLKRWFAKQQEREQEKAEAKKRKLQKLKQLTEGPPLPVIDDPEYNQQRAEMPDKVYAAVDKGFEAQVQTKASSSAVASSTSTSDDSSTDSPVRDMSSTEVVPGTSSGAGPSSSISRDGARNEFPIVKKKAVFKRTMLDEDLDSDSCSSSDDSEETAPKKAKLGS